MLEGVRGCWSGLEGVGVAWNSVGMVLEWCWSGLEWLGGCLLPVSYLGTADRVKI